MIELPGMAAVWSALPEARIVGGAVRDMLAGVPVRDVDFAVPLAPEAVVERLERAGLRAVPTGLAHGTVTAVSDGRAYEITTLRRDVATDGRHATVAFTDDWRADAARRDFTINAMSAGRDGAVHDYFGGQTDLAAGRVRFVGAAAQRIAEDYLRVLRFFRFLARYGRGAPDAEAVTAINEARAGLARLSTERVWMELKLLLGGAAADAALLSAVALMAETGVLEAVLPGARADGLAKLLQRGAGAPNDPLLRLVALTPEAPDELAARLKMSGAEAERVAALAAPAPALSPGMDDGALRGLLADAAPDVLIQRSWLCQDGEAGWPELRRRLAALPRPVFPLAGRDVAALGVAPGPRMGALLRSVRGWWLAGGCVADAAACRAELRRLLDGDADPELDHPVARDAEELGARGGVAGHEQEDGAADEA